MTPSPLTLDQVHRLSRMSPEQQMALMRLLSPAQLLALDAQFEAWAHEGQLPPRCEGWRTWLMMAGRGYGKTRAGAEWITKLATQRFRQVRIALVGASEAEVRAVMIEGQSGLLNVGRGQGIVPRWEPSLKRLRWPGGSEAFVYSGEAPDGLRGPEHHFAWCDELAKWARPEESWDNLQMGLRCGERPRALVTTTPRPVPILKKIEDHKLTVKTTGRTSDNIHLSEDFVRAMAETYGGTRLGRQELDGEMIADVDGALWTREMLEEARVLRYASSAGSAATQDERIEFKRIVIGVDPPAGAGASSDACGIVAVGLGHEGTAYVLGDHSVQGLSPEGWARAVAEAAALHEADRVVAEANNGGAMVESVLRAADTGLPVTLVHASRGKSARAEPVAALYEKGRVKHAGRFAELEDELAGLTIGGGYEGAGRSPDRADALVWAVTELMLGKRAKMPRVRML